MENNIVLLVVISSIWVLIDAHRIGVKKGLITGFFDLGAWGWFFVTLFLWIVGFPAYLMKRSELKLATCLEEPDSIEPPLLKCPSCKNDIAINAQSCPQCGHKLKTSFLVTLFKILISVILIIFILIIIGAAVEEYKVYQNKNTPQSQENTSVIPKLNTSSIRPLKKEKYRKIKKLDYRKAVSKEYPKNQPIKVVGEVLQIIDDRNILIDTLLQDENPVRFYGNIVWLTSDKPIKLLDNGLAVVFGQYLRTRKYGATNGREKTVPLIYVDYSWSTKKNYFLLLQKIKEVNF